MKLPAVVREINVFVLVGIAATATNYVATLATHRFLGLGTIAAGVAGYVSSVGISYFGNALFTFRRPPAHGPQFARFMTISLAGLAINLGVLYAGAHVLCWPLWLAEVPVVIVVPAATFVMAKFWAFREPAAAKPAT